ncbi:hypothetical protein Vadar_014120 [Vaccinium darrowii]|uniref:Uncharacterized protein n=1 Tax=Vaccinium darrowii TaxID=229202 RepID=A0ACB7X0J6_9ERIC|nr:hypothetical protein Vadar_014120 [Vaccinium darrowii]
MLLHGALASSIREDSLLYLSLIVNGDSNLIVVVSVCVRTRRWSSLKVKQSDRCCHCISFEAILKSIRGTVNITVEKIYLGYFEIYLRIQGVLVYDLVVRIINEALKNRHVKKVSSLPDFLRLLRLVQAEKLVNRVEEYPQRLSDEAEGRVGKGKVVFVEVLVLVVVVDLEEGIVVRVVDAFLGGDEEVDNCEDLVGVVEQRVGFLGQDGEVARSVEVFGLEEFLGKGAQVLYIIVLMIQYSSFYNQCLWDRMFALHYHVCLDFILHVLP